MAKSSFYSQACLQALLQVFGPPVARLTLRGFLVVALVLRVVFRMCGLWVVSGPRVGLFALSKIFLLWRSSNSSRRTDLQRRTPPWVSRMCSLEVLVRPNHLLSMFLRKMSRHRLSKGDQFTGVRYTFQLLERGLSTLTSLIPGLDPSTVTDQPRIELVTFSNFDVILVSHKNFVGSSHDSHGLIHAFTF